MKFWTKIIVIVCMHIREIVGGAFYIWGVGHGMVGVWGL